MFSPKLWYHHFEKSPGFTKSWLMDMPIWKLNEHLAKGQGGINTINRWHSNYLSQWTRMLQWISPSGLKNFMLSLLTP